jgi:hypothetical protein
LIVEVSPTPRLLKQDPAQMGHVTGSSRNSRRLPGIPQGYCCNSAIPGNVTYGTYCVVPTKPPRGTALARQNDCRLLAALQPALRSMGLFHAYLCGEMEPSRAFTKPPLVTSILPISFPDGSVHGDRGARLRSARSEDAASAPLTPAAGRRFRVQSQAVPTPKNLTVGLPDLIPAQAWFARPLCHRKGG